MATDDGEDLLIGVGFLRENLHFEIQRYDFDVAPINTVSFTYMYPFSDLSIHFTGLCADGLNGAALSRHRFWRFSCRRVRQYPTGGRTGHPLLLARFLAGV